ncbi:MAG: recombination regulator RecX [Gammaproteobacteria bacterium]|nr:recombination regulator RecX [Gammaproteobacteria bacterium]MBT8134121.1 recombination regulator RecX [Gammaproteobacteria bacterium]NNJ50546.1 regulatory protein RecX [Gammaproteobacteria bacterium]
MSAKSVAVKLLSRREHSAFEIRDKLQKRDFEEEEIAQAICELEQGGWLSDERYTEAYIRMRQQKGFGPLRIAIELNERGVDERIIDTYLQDVEDSWQQILEQQYLKKYKNRPVEDYSDKAKRIRFLQYRGFHLDAIYQLVDKTII